MADHLLTMKSRRCAPSEKSRRRTLSKTDDRVLLTLLENSDHKEASIAPKEPTRLRDCSMAYLKIAYIPTKEPRREPSFDSTIEEQLRWLAMPCYTKRAPYAISLGLITYTGSGLGVVGTLSSKNLCQRRSEGANKEASSKPTSHIFSHRSTTTQNRVTLI